MKFVYVLGSWALSHIGRTLEWQMNLAQEPLDNALVLGNLCNYRHKSYIAKTRFFGLHFFVADSIGLSSITLT